MLESWSRHRGEGFVGRRGCPPEFRREVLDLVEAGQGPNQPSVTDITEYPTREGTAYCAVVVDVYSRRVVGWSIDASPTRRWSRARSGW